MPPRPLYPAERAKVAEIASAGRAWSQANEALRLLDRAWIHAHYGLGHRSVEAGDRWPDKCSDDPCPAIRAALLGLAVRS